jgi:hypothetical protein
MGTQSHDFIEAERIVDALYQAGKLDEAKVREFTTTRKIDGRAPHSAVASERLRGVERLMELSISSALGGVAQPGADQPNDFWSLVGRLFLPVSIAPPRSERMTGPTPPAWSRRSASADRRSGCNGITRPLLFLATQSLSSTVALTRPEGSRTMSQVRFAISPARRPALADSNTIARFRRGFRARQAKRRS